MLKWERKQFHVWKDPRHPRKGQGHCFVVRRKLTLYTWGWFHVRLISSQLQSIELSVPCMQQQCAVMDPAVISTPHYRHGTRRRIITWYESPTPVYFITMASSGILACNAPGWHIIVRDLVTLDARPYLLKRLIRTFIVCYIQYDSCEPTMPLLAYKTPKNCPKVSPCPSCDTLWYSTVMARQVLMVFSTITLNIVGDTSTPCIVPLVSGKVGPRKPFCLRTTWWKYQKVSKSLHIRGPVPYPSRVMRRRSRSTVS